MVNASGSVATEAGAPESFLRASATVNCVPWASTGTDAE